MYETLEVDHYRRTPPPLFATLTELPRTLLEISALIPSLPGLSLLPRGDGHPVLLLPGFLAGDESTSLLRNYLKYMGYQPEGWHLGRNTGKPWLLQEGLVDRVTELLDRYGQNLSIIGQSLGGVYAREIAKMFPDSVRQVITLGSPFGAESSRSTMQLVSTLFKRQSGMSVEEMRTYLEEVDTTASPDVPVTAVFSKGDGVVNWRVCREQVEDHQTQNIQVCGSHCGMAFNTLIYAVIATRLSLPADGWEPLDLGPFKGQLKEVTA